MLKSINGFKRILIKCTSILLMIVLFCMMIPSSTPGLFAVGASEEIGNNENPKNRVWHNKPVSEMNKFDYVAEPGAMLEPEPYNTWQQLYTPIGNGMIGAAIMGEVDTEHLVFNEKTLWSGGPSPKRPNYDGGNITEKRSYVTDIGNNYTNITMAEMFNISRESMRETGPGWHTDGEYLSCRLIGEDMDAKGGGFGDYLPFGDVYFDFKNVDKTKKTNYNRTLDLENALVNVSYDLDETNYQREYFASYPNDVIAMKFTASGKNKLNFDIRLESANGGASSVDGNVITNKGRVADNAMIFNHQIIAESDGVITDNGRKLTVSDASEVTMFMAAATDYELDYPVYRTGESEEEVAKRVNNSLIYAVDNGYTQVKNTHIKDYRNLYQRVSLNFGQAIDENVPTDKMVESYMKGTLNDDAKRYMEVLMFQMGRYLTISSSRQSSELPSNLQGLWNPNPNPPWHGDYHVDLNLQFNYSLAYSTNLVDTVMPYLNFIEALREPGRVTAEVYTGIASAPGTENGFTVHAATNPFGWTAPGQIIHDKCTYQPIDTAWLVTSAYDYYKYTLDENFLRDRLYPMMKELVNYYDKLLIDDGRGQGRLVMGPNHSPEQQTPNTLGSTNEQSFMWQIFSDTVEAAEILNVDSNLIPKWKYNISKFFPIEINENGFIKEWYEEVKHDLAKKTTIWTGDVPCLEHTSHGWNKYGGPHEYGDTNHRHVGQLMGLWPCKMLDAQDNSKGYVTAAKLSLDNRTGVNSMGYNNAEFINLWARMNDGEQAFKYVQHMLSKATYQNMMASCPPFMIEGQAAYSAGIAEMLLQSHLGDIRLLPALPTAWKDGFVKGLVAQGNFVIDMEWKNSNLTKAKITSNVGGKAVINRNQTIKKITDSNGKNVSFTTSGNIATFNTVKGMSYNIAY